MTLRETVDLIFNEESNPVKVATKINQKLKKLNKFSNTDFIGLIKTISNEVLKDKIPIGNNKYISIKNDTELNSYIEQIYNNIDIQDIYTDIAIKNILQTLKQEIKSKINS